MPRLDESGEALLHAGQETKERVKGVWGEFVDFLFSDNVLAVAVGLMYNPPSPAATATRAVDLPVRELLLTCIQNRISFH